MASAGCIRSDSSPDDASTRPASAVARITVEIAGQRIELPEGLTIDVFAEELGAPRFMALDDQGVVHVTDRRGRVLKLPDEDGDGRADRAITVLDGLVNPHGITFYDGVLYVAEETSVGRVEDRNSDGVFDAPKAIIESLPEKGHWSRTIRFGPDGALYLSVGSSCNVCIEDDPLRAAIWRYAPDGSGGELFAAGLRNAVGITFSPNGELWATNNGRDGMGDDVPPETVNHVRDGDDFGWPRCHAGDLPDPDLGGDRGCEGVAQPAVEMQAHSAPLGLTFAAGAELGPAFADGIFVAFHGSWNRSEPTGYKVVWLPFHEGAPTGEVIDFASGWLTDDGHVWGRPVDVLIMPDGSLLVSDDEGGRIFRISRADGADS